MSLEIQANEIGGNKLLRLIGRLDTETSADFELAAYDAHQAGARQFVVDLSEVSYVSSAGLRVLLALAKKLDGQGALKLCGVKGIVKEVFEKSGFAKLFAIYADVQTAAGAAPVQQVARNVQSDAISILTGKAASPARNSAAATPNNAPGFFTRLLAIFGLGKK
jgi:anti-anti-sigma factor